MKITLEGISSGKSGVGKNGKPYQMIGLKTKEHPDIWINGFGGGITKTWKQGDVVDVEVYDEEYNGKIYKKFRLPKADNSTLEIRIKKLEEQVLYLAKKMGIGDKQALPSIPNGSNELDVFDDFKEEEGTIPF